MDFLFRLHIVLFQFTFWDRVLLLAEPVFKFMASSFCGAMGLQMWTTVSCTSSGFSAVNWAVVSMWRYSSWWTDTHPHLTLLGHGTGYIHAKNMSALFVLKKASCWAGCSWRTRTTKRWWGQRESGDAVHVGWRLLKFGDLFWECVIGSEPNRAFILLSYKPVSHIPHKLSHLKYSRGITKTIVQVHTC